jgi:RecB family exonuclease
MIAAAAPSANATAVPDPDHLSFSALSTYRSCPLRYWFKYVAGLPEESVSASLVFGGAIHAAVERHYEAVLLGENLPFDELLAAYRTEWDERDTGSIRFGVGEDRTSLDDLAHRMLTAFLASDAARPAGRILGIEEELRGALIPGVPDVLARLDLLVETDTALVVQDLKTARSRWSRAQAEDSAEQLLLYGAFVERMVPDKPVRLEFVVLTKTKQPVVERHVVRADPARTARLLAVVERVWRAIAAGHFYPSPSALNCPTCPFRAPCRAWRG